MLKDFFEIIRNRRNAINSAKQKLGLLRLMRGFYEPDEDSPYDGEIEEMKREIKRLEAYNPFQIFFFMLTHRTCGGQ